MLVQTLKRGILVCTPSQFGDSPCCVEPLKSWSFIVHQQMGCKDVAHSNYFGLDINNKTGILRVKMKKTFKNKIKSGFASTQMF